MNNPQPYDMSADDLEDLKLTLLEMLSEIDRICRKNQIHYTLFMGTLLGAVRHKGFIPWDDDLDIAMLRSDYEKFARSCRQDLDQERFFYQNHLTDPNYRWGYARMRRRNSEYVRLGQEHMTMQTGIFLDIFPLDGTPDFYPLRTLHCFFCFFLRKALYSEVGQHASGSFGVRLLFRAMNLIPHVWVLRTMTWLSKLGRQTVHVRILGFPPPQGKELGYLRRWFKSYTHCEFEAGAFPGIKDYDAYLKYSYGDYMTFPPPEKRVGGHPPSRFSAPRPLADHPALRNKRSGGVDRSKFST